MERTFILLLFIATTPLVLSISRKYYLIQQFSTWDDARVYCQANYDDLAIIDGDANLNRYVIETQLKKFTGSAWIGLYVDFMSQHWSYGFQPLGSFHPWCAGEPDNYGGYYQCGAISATCWSINPCNWQVAFVCFDDRFTDSRRYIYYATPVSWYDAQIYCRLHHTDLATASNAAENSALLASGITSWAWIGLSRDNLNWVDPTISAPIVFIPGQPDGAGIENCGYVYLGQVADAPCMTPIYFICYSSQFPLVRMKQSVRMMIQSDQDVNDPILKAAILVMIQQKLQELGLVKNIKLRWIESLDKEAFNKI